MDKSLAYTGTLTKSGRKCKKIYIKMVVRVKLRNHFHGLNRSTVLVLLHNMNQQSNEWISLFNVMTVTQRI